jgi:hypothetical protein
MNAEQAKETLLSYRPGSNEDQDPEVRVALDMANRDAELQSWLARQGDFHAKIRQSLRRIEPPAGLKSRLLATRVPARKIVWWNRPELLALAAVLTVLSCLLVFWVSAPAGEKFPEFHARMAKTALREYRMSMLASDPAQIRDFLANKGHPANYQMPEKLSKLTGVGCALLRWNDHPVSLVCLRQPNQALIWLFVTKAEVFKDPPATSTPEFRQTGKLATATWTRQGLTYILAGIGDKALVEQYL